MFSQRAEAALVSLFNSSLGCLVSQLWCGFLVPLTLTWVKAKGWHLGWEFTPVPSPSLSSDGTPWKYCNGFLTNSFLSLGQRRPWNWLMACFQEGNAHHNQNNSIFTGSSIAHFFFFQSDSLLPNNDSLVFVVHKWLDCFLFSEMFSSLVSVNFFFRSSTGSFD